MINRKGMEMKNGRMGPNIRAVTSQGKNRAKALSLGRMGPNIKETFWITICMASALANIKMVGAIMACGRIIK